ncbi:MAG: hypothetical protein DI598_01485 [Pseudopedobacter saltans]|uniref:YtkA-like domain-containing protein n=1 Tax=Pseudopedobacter saltans TaxID=151895 RepID=A0A2W5FCS2_9SPHI|nr:MAG: hypothetical protein DI598_01485 [Pseudopedobacter saltans]
MRNIFVMAAMLCGIVLSTSCSKSDNSPVNIQPLSNLTKISENKIPNSPYTIATFLTTDSIIVGYNPLYFTIQDTSTRNYVNNANIVLAPLMTEAGSTHHHSGPTEQPSYSDSARAYKGAFIPLHGAIATYGSLGFTGWRMRMSITINGAQYDSVKYDFSTKTIKTGTKFVTSVAGNDGLTYYFALINPQQSSQANGIQNLEVAFYNSADGNITFNPINDLVIGNFYPYMPDMGHSSPNNITPTSIGNGHYKGVVNFTMGGHWTLNFTKIQKNNVQVIDSTALEVAF